MFGNNSIMTSCFEAQFKVTKFLTFCGHCIEINTRHHGYRFQFESGYILVNMSWHM